MNPDRHQLAALADHDDPSLSGLHRAAGLLDLVRSLPTDPEADAHVGRVLAARYPASRKLGILARLLAPIRVSRPDQK